MKLSTVSAHETLSLVLLLLSFRLVSVYPLSQFWIMRPRGCPEKGKAIKDNILADPTTWAEENSIGGSLIALWAWWEGKPPEENWGGGASCFLRCGRWRSLTPCTAPSSGLPAAPSGLFMNWRRSLGLWWRACQGWWGHSICGNSVTPEGKRSVSFHWQCSRCPRVYLQESWLVSRVRLHLHCYLEAQEQPFCRARLGYTLDPIPHGSGITPFPHH